MDTTTNNKTVFLNRTAMEWFSSLPVMFLLVLTLVIGTGEMIHGQLLRMGENMFGNPSTGVQYFMMRVDPQTPDCDPNMDIDQAVQAQLANTAASDDPFAALFDEAPDPDAIRSSLESAKSQCVERHDLVVRIKDNMSPQVKAFRAVETSFFGIFKFGTENRPLLLITMLLIAAATTTLTKHHINIRPPRTMTDHRVYSGAMVIGNALLLYSSWFYYNNVLIGSGIAIEKPIINYLTIGMFAILTAISIKHFFEKPENVEGGDNFGKALLCIPLYAIMAITSAFSFFGDKHFAGLAIYMGQIFEFANIFLNLALYIWAGMLLKQTRVVELFLDIVRPWKFSSETLTWILLLAAAIPTAYTGASGIFVIAAGFIIYKEVANSGARKQYALAAAAMSGSMGVVLRPCLLIVLIAALNKQVTTTELYGWGVGVFLVSSTIFLIFSLFLKEVPSERADFGNAMRESLRALVPVSPYFVITIVVVYAYKYLLNTQLDEFTAPVILPIILLAIVVFDKLRREPKHVAVQDNPAAERRLSLEGALRVATNDTIGHIGALIMLMALSVSVGGVIERAHIMDNVPSDLGNIFLALTIFMFMLVAIGMIMDPFGAVILVSATIAPIAYANGINPIHFWMIVLAAFELGYLSPPVALNQLLTRQVVGEAIMDAADAEVKDRTFYYRYERWILPVVVMFVSLLIVTYGGYMLSQHGAEWQAALNSMLGMK